MKQSNNKFESNKKYFTIFVYGIVFVLISIFIIKAVIDWNQTMKFFKSVIKILSPFVLAALFAYILNPLVQQLRRLYSKLTKRDKLSLGLSIATAYILVAAVIYVILLYIIPQISKSISDVVGLFPSAYDQIIALVDDVEKNFPDFDYTYIDKVLTNFLPNITEKLGNITDQILPMLLNTSISIVKLLFNLVISIIVSLYMLIDKERLFRESKKCIYAFLPESASERTLTILAECNRILNKFIVGKAIDSMIIGFLCFILLSIFSIPYALFISVIVGITNMIPYFGPFLGAIPSALILIFISPMKCVIFLILILALQQFDGLVLGPKILGDSTGLRPLWIIIAITIGGSLAGVVGMFFGVPIVAILRYLLLDAIDTKVKKKEAKRKKELAKEEFSKEEE